MKELKGIFKALVAMAAMIVFVSGCGGGDNPVEPVPPEPTILKVVVRSSVDSTLVDNSNVVVYEAASGEAVFRNLTNAEGAVYFDLGMGNYYLDISAQGYASVPPQNISPVPFFVAREDTTIQDIYLNALENPGNSGYVQGFVEPAINNFLILAEAQTGGEKFATVSGPDGFFILFNLPYDTFELDALKSGYRMEGTTGADISGSAPVDTVQIQVAPYQGSILAGQVTFLASENSTVDITLLDPETREVIPGLTVMSDVSGLDYRIVEIPDGDYLAWASLQNDGYVIDPDWVFKNPGGLDISFATSSTLDLNFSVTDAITILSPTNPPDSTFAFMADSPVPVFRWMSYPSAKEYFIEVRDLSGNVIWGGLDDSGTAQHAFIGAGAESVVFDFDKQPGIPLLKPGEIYQWKLWADKGTMQDGFAEELISSSEDLLGIFQVPESPPLE